ncbi:hypothetical protein [Nitrosopumilus maritimus]|uniref:Uncharacterized protein n=1 Tax=Nitrosopumilus maritimus (strain SCM1) TaxID=436308 RepID=A9A5U9_NITMS|nr:hypothetical protein [Nitrosopumilus maritimus]ABX13104.1 hypothetical protein Nmar_1208 [Nitrosopumilus maritimus SCM1]
MKQKILLLAALFAPLLLVFSNIPAAEAQQSTNYEHDPNIEKVIVEKREGTAGYANYLVKICADDSSMKLGKMMLHSDLDQILLEFNKSLAKGDCTFAGAVLKNSNLDSLGATFLN